MSDFIYTVVILGGSATLGMMLAHLVLDWWEDQ